MPPARPGGFTWCDSPLERMSSSIARHQAQLDTTTRLMWRAYSLTRLDGHSAFEE